MAREKWLVDPGELDEFQREILGLSINDSYVIKGCAGSGKTVLALYRARDIRNEILAEDGSSPPSFTFVVYTKALREFIRSGVHELGIPLDQVIHFQKWDRRIVDYLIVDEAQDFTKEEIDTFQLSKRKSIMLYGDSQQQVYKSLKKVLSIEELEAYLGLPKHELDKNYRLPKQIASFASELTRDKKLEAKCVKDGPEKPKIKKFENWQKELDFIFNEIRTRNYLDVGILLPFNVKSKAPTNNFHRNVESVREYLDSKGIPHLFKMRHDEDDSMQLDFDSDLPKVMTYHSSKGLQFETVFIPFGDMPNHDQFIADNYTNPLYVGLTRTYRNLYITHSERLTPFFNKISTSKYE